LDARRLVEIATELVCDAQDGASFERALEGATFLGGRIAAANANRQIVRFE
jgi:hypothetical protein